MAKTRAEILASVARRYTEVDGVRLQNLTELELSTLRGVWGKRYLENPDSEDFLASQRKELLAMTIVDDEGKRVFANDEVELVGGMDAAVTEPLYYAAQKHVGLDKEEDEKEVQANEKKSESTAG